MANSQLPSPDETAATKRRFLRDIALLLGIPFVGLVGLVVWWAPWKSYVPPGGGSVFGAAAGTWDWEGADSLCVKNPHTIAFSSDSSLMILTQKEPWTDSMGTSHRVAEYDIQQHTTNRIRGIIRGETRLTESRIPVVWDLVLISHDSYHWHRADWKPYEFTKTIWRCPT